MSEWIRARFARGDEFVSEISIPKLARPVSAFGGERLCTRAGTRLRFLAGILCALSLTAFVPSASRADCLSSAPPCFQLLGTGTHAAGVSRDGSTVVGYITAADGHTHAARWRTGSFTDLGVLPGYLNGGAIGTNSNGQVIVGYSDLGSTGGSQAFRWTSSGGMAGLGFPQCPVSQNQCQSVGFATNADGSVVAGHSVYDTFKSMEAFRWSNGNVQSLGFLPVNGYSLAGGVSDDGSVIVGTSGASNGFGQILVGSAEAYLWTQAGGMIDLGRMPGGQEGSFANAVSGDGHTVVGQSGTPVAVRWSGGEMYVIGPGGIGTSSAANAVNGDGTVVVGSTFSNAFNSAFRWINGVGNQSIGTLLTQAGINFGIHHPAYAYGVSADGITIVGDTSDGNGQVNMQGFIARLALPPAGKVLIWDVHTTVNNGSEYDGTAVVANPVIGSVTSETSTLTTNFTFTGNADGSFNVTLDFVSPACNATFSGTGTIQFNSGTEQRVAAVVPSVIAGNCSSPVASFFATAHDSAFDDQLAAISGNGTAWVIHNGVQLTPQLNMDLTNGDALKTSAGVSLNVRQADGQLIQIGPNGLYQLGPPPPSVVHQLGHWLLDGPLTLLDDTSCSPNNCNKLYVCPCYANSSSCPPKAINGRCPAPTAAIGVRGTGYTAQLSSPSGAATLSLSVTQGQVEYTDVNGNDVLLSAGQSRTFTGLPVAHGPAPHDFNGDGRSDILWRNVFGDATIWFMAGGGGIQGGESLGNIPTAWSVVGVRDFNGDGTSDILWRNTGGDATIWFLNNGSVSSGTKIGNIPTVWSVVGTGDFNGDGKGDILWRDTAGDTTIWLMNGGTITSAVSLGTIPAIWSVAGTGDFNGDGTTDIVWHDTAGDVTIWLMNKGSVTQGVGVGNLPTNWSIVGTGDFNGDGITDILWRNTAGDVLIWLMNNNATLKQQEVIANVSVQWRVAGTGDLNGDGRSDIIWLDTSGNVMSWLMTGFSAAALNLGNVGTAWSISGANAD